MGETQLDGQSLCKISRLFLLCRYYRPNLHDQIMRRIPSRRLERRNGGVVICLKCGGTGKNGLSEAAATERLKAIPLDSLVGPDFKVCQTHGERVREMQKCGYCKDGERK